MRALIVGAGIGGLAAGLSLRRSGWEVRIYERAAEPRELGFGLLLAANALAALDELGIGEPVRRAGAVNGWVEIRRPDGGLIRRLHAPLGGPSIVALRATLHGALLAAVGEDALRPGFEVTGVESLPGGVALQYGDGTSEEGDIVVGADGVGSVIRRVLHPDEAPAAPSGYTAIRGVAYGAAHWLGALSGIIYLGRGIEAAAIRAASDAVYWYISLQSGAVAAGAVRAILDPLLVGFDEVFRGVVAATSPGDVRLDELLQRAPLPSWGHGRITLLGDAAHPVLPHTGQGAAQALEDAVALGLALRGADPEDGSRRYEAVRARRTREFVRLGPRIARITTTTNPAIIAARTVMLRLLPSRVLALSTRTLRQDPHRALRVS